MNRLLFSATITVVLAFTLSAAIASAAVEQLSLAVIDVGQGDSIFLQGPDGYAVLVDGGRGGGTARRVTWTREAWPC